MHPSALKYGKLFFDVYFSDRSAKSLKFVEVGSQDVNGSLKQFSPIGSQYVGVDFVAGKGVDLILDDPYSLPFEDKSVDAVLCSSVYEHSEFFWLLFLESLRILKPNGLLYINAPSNGMLHSYPVDAWRFYPDSGLSLTNWARRNSMPAVLMESFIGSKMGDFIADGMWNDFVAVIARDENFVPSTKKRIFQTDASINANLIRGDGISHGGDADMPDLSMIKSQQKEIKLLNKLLNEKNKTLNEKELLIIDLNHMIEILKATKSWRYTAPFRKGLKAYNFFLVALNFTREVVSRNNGYLCTLRRITSLVKRDGIVVVYSKMLALYRQFNGVDGRWLADKKNSYKIWIEKYSALNSTVKHRIMQEITDLSYKPRISILMPVFDTPVKLLAEAINSVKNQLYENWELCIADDASTNPEVREVLEKFIKEDSRIKVNFNNINGHISAASNSALELAVGDYVALLDHDDLLSEDALYHIAKIINDKPDVALIYSDEDKVDLDGNRFDPYFKTDWNPDLFYSHNMFCHLGVYKRSLVNDIGGFRLGFEGSQDYDLALRCIERIDADQIVHLPFILYHWRVHPNSTSMNADAKPYAMIAGERAINEHFHRTGVNGRVQLMGYGYRPIYELPTPLPLVSIIIPTRNSHKLVNQCIDSIIKLSTYPAYEIILIDNGSDDFESIQEWRRLESQNVRVLRDDSPFNYSALNNNAATIAQGEVLVLLNNDTEVIEPRWLEIMVSHAVRPGIGPVGAKLLYPDNSIQHAGVVLGLGGQSGAAGHAHYKFPGDSPGYFGRISLTSNFSAVTGACLAVRRDLYLKVGGLDEENLRVAFNDVDFCLKLGELGYRCVYAPDAVLYHHESASRGAEDNPEKKARFKQETDWMRARWGSLIDNDPHYSPNLTIDHADFSLAWPPRMK
jgi:O-antigen biosynthesis protein